MPKSRPEPPISFSFLTLSWFECRRISNGSNSFVCNAPSCQTARISLTQGAGSTLQACAGPGRECRWHGPP